MKPIDRRCRGYWSGVMALAMIAVAPVVAWGQAGQVVQAGPEWVGQRVITRFGAVLQADGRVIDDEKLENRSRGGKRREFRIYRVEEVNGPWLLLKQERGTANGWITAGWLIPLDGAFEFFKKEIAANPGNASAYLYRGHLWKDARQYDNAIADYNQAIRIDPGNEGAWLGRGVALSLKNDPAKALVDFNEAIRLDPSYAIA
jgi:tetratricopeptide (TPR) repeat protein